MKQAVKKRNPTIAAWQSFKALPAFQNDFSQKAFYFVEWALVSLCVMAFIGFFVLTFYAVIIGVFMLDV